MHLSAAGADPHSSSRFLRTKWYGEQEVKEIYPDVTILRPTSIFSSYNTDSSFVGRWTTCIRMLSGTGLIVGDGCGKVQPVYNTDVALGIYNCLKMPETIGQTYELGGPVTYTYKELYEFMFNAVNLHPYMISITPEMAFDYYNAPLMTSASVGLPVITRSYRKYTCTNTSTRTRSSSSRQAECVRRGPRASLTCTSSQCPSLS